jgi:hypothetical protein
MMRSGLLLHNVDTVELAINKQALQQNIKSSVYALLETLRA